MDSQVKINLGAIVDVRPSDVAPVMEDILRKTAPKGSNIAPIFVQQPQANENGNNNRKQNENYSDKSQKSKFRQCGDGLADFPLTCELSTSNAGGEDTVERLTHQVSS